MVMNQNNAFLLVLIAASLLFYPLNAQNSQQDFLNAHNAARSDVGVPDVTWDTTLENYAQDYANQRIGDCNLVHSGGPFGENLAEGSGDFSAVSAVGLWVDEQVNYDFDTNSCIGGECRHYTQVIWSNTVNIGCARVQCDNGSFFVICSYNPPGNVQGQGPIGNDKSISKSNTYIKIK